MHSKAKTVDEYINTPTVETRIVIQKIRNTFIKHMPEYQKSKKYKIPTWENGSSGAIEQFGHKIGKHSTGKKLHPLFKPKIH